MTRKATPKALPDAARFTRRLLAWFRREGRDLPWRRTRDPYAILVSEVMLQQTQVSRVEGYWHRFLTRFPDLQSLAEAPPAQVRESWAGLGYYRRAANLHRLAQRVMADHGGAIPTEPEVLVTLPGIGRYTAGAVASFAHERSTPAVDTNVARVLRRVFHPRMHKRGADRRLWDTAARLVPPDGQQAWMFNQAIMELGALICTARVARCGICPVRVACRTGREPAKSSGTPARRMRGDSVPK
jgi:A/G-specific adenine glycosylase